MPALAADKAPSITLYFVQDLGIQTMAPRDGVEEGLMEAPLQVLHDHQDPLMEEGEVVVVADSQGMVMAAEVPQHVSLGPMEFP